MNILYSILYAALTVILALAPFGVLYLMHRKKKIEFWQLLLGYTVSLIVFEALFIYFLLSSMIASEVFYLLYIYALFFIFSPLIFKKFIQQPKTFQGAIVLMVALFIIGSFASFVLIPFGLSGLSGKL